MMPGTRGEAGLKYGMCILKHMFYRLTVGLGSPIDISAHNTEDTSYLLLFGSLERL
jgi:hypothetical protein